MRVIVNQVFYYSGLGHKPLQFYSSKPKHILSMKMVIQKKPSLAASASVNDSGDTSKPVSESEYSQDEISPFLAADETMGDETRTTKMFKTSSIKTSETKSEFDEIFGENPLDFLICEFGIPIYEAEINRAGVEKHGIPQKGHIPVPPALTFESMQELNSKQWTERACPEEFYFDTYLREAVTNATEYAFEEADKVRVTEDHRALKLFHPLDCVAEHLWTHNKKHPDRLGLTQQEIPVFKEFLKNFPRTKPPLHLQYTVEEAAVIIQKRWKGTLTRRRPDIKSLRRHIATAKVQYNDPRKLVEELWNRPVPKVSGLPETNTSQEDKIKPAVIHPRGPGATGNTLLLSDKLPKYLLQMKETVEKRVAQKVAAQQHREILRRFNREQLTGAELSSDSDEGDSDEEQCETEAVALDGAKTTLDQGDLSSPNTAAMESRKSLNVQPDAATTGSTMSVPLGTAPVGQLDTTININPANIQSEGKDSKEKAGIAGAENVGKKVAKPVKPGAAK